MDFLEKDLEEIIYDATLSDIGREHLLDRGLDICGKVFRQVNLGPYGIADLISVNYMHKILDLVEGGLISKTRYVHVTIYELKKDSVNINTLTQALRYRTAINEIIESRFSKFGDQLKVYINIVLVGKTFDKSNGMSWLLNELERIEVYTYNYSLTGLQFEEIPAKGWSYDEAPNLKFTPSLYKSIIHWSNTHFGMTDSLSYLRDPQSNSVPNEPF